VKEDSIHLEGGLKEEEQKIAFDKRKAENNQQDC